MVLRTGSSFLAILLLAVVGCVNAYGTVQYFKVMKTPVSQGEMIQLKCGATLSQEGDEVHTLILHIRKSFAGSRQWLLSVNEQVETNEHNRYDAEMHQIDQIKEVEFNILDAQPGDTGNYTCDTSRNNMTVTVDVISQPKQIVVSLNTTGEVANVNTMPDAAHPNKTGDQVEVRLDQSVGVHCVATGGNPQPTVNFSSGNVQYDGVKVTAMTERDSFDMMSEPRHVVTASLVWTPKVSEIAIPFVCTTGSAETKVISASFVPIVADTQPLFSCANEVELEDGVDDLKVTCRIVSVRAALEIIKVRVFGEHGKNFTIAPALYDSDEPTETAYSNDNRYVVRIVRHQATYSWDVTLTINNARNVKDLNSHKLEFVAENPYDVTVHTVSVNADGGPNGAPSSMTVSVATILFAMVLGAFGRP